MVSVCLYVCLSVQERADAMQHTHIICMCIPDSDSRLTNCHVVCLSVQERADTMQQASKKARLAALAADHGVYGHNYPRSQVFIYL
jgi:hypothetical protein